MIRSISTTARSHPSQQTTRRSIQPRALEPATEGLPLVVGCGVALAGLSAAYVVSDPQKRRDIQLEQSGGEEKDSVREYFNGEGFDRWRRIYGTNEDVNKVQKDIRDGHAITIEKTLKWLTQKDMEGTSVCDAGCGTGSLAIPLSLLGADVTASDISDAMVKEAQARFEAASKGMDISTRPTFETRDLESLTGQFDTVTCLDVMIHYPQEKADEMVSHLASLAKERLIISFAPKTTYYSVLKRIGEFFPGPSKATRAYLHAEADVETALNKEGFKVVQREMTATSFYFSRLLDARTSLIEIHVRRNKNSITSVQIMRDVVQCHSHSHSKSSYS